MIIILWDWVFWWIASGIITAVVVAYANDCFKKKEISVNVALAMLSVIALGWIGLIVTFLLGIIAGIVVMIEHGDKPLIRWGNK